MLVGIHKALECDTDQNEIEWNHKVAVITETELVICCHERYLLVYALATLYSMHCWMKCIIRTMLYAISNFQLLFCVLLQHSQSIATHTVDSGCLAHLVN